jgi:hypothetical protein
VTGLSEKDWAVGEDVTGTAAGRWESLHTVGTMTEETTSAAELHMLKYVMTSCLVRVVNAKGGL